MIPGPIQEQWLQTLEQHPERQLRHKLGHRTDEGDKMCCLGQLGLLAGICEWHMKTLKTIPLHLVNILYDFKSVGLYSGSGRSKDFAFPALSKLNDSGKTWPEIAAIVRANPDHYFTHAV